LQVDLLKVVLDEMAASRRLPVDPDCETALVPHLTSNDFMPTRTPYGNVYGAEASCADSVSIGQRFKLHTVRGTHKWGRMKVECYGYVPFIVDGRVQHCVFRLDALFSVLHSLFGGAEWSNGPAGKLALGTIWEAQPVDGLGLCSDFNDDPDVGRVRYPTKLQVSSGTQPYRWLIHVHQIVCPLVSAPGPDGKPSHYYTYLRGGFHGDTSCAAGPAA
jgi:hypothetical protein